MIYNGGPVLGTSSAVVVTPIYWAPTGFTFPSTYQSLTEQFLTNVAQASGATSNVFSNLTQYTDQNNRPILNSFIAGTPINVANVYPTSGGCIYDSGQVYSDTTGYSACLTDAQIQSEISSVRTARGLASDANHIYLMFLPKGVESCLTAFNNSQGGRCTVSAQGAAFCGYHSNDGSTIYADLPYAVVDSPSNYTCSSIAGSLSGGSSVGNQSPNGNIDADTVISVTSHEMNEIMTDPFGTAWFDSTGNEIGDDCASIYGDSSNFVGPSGSEYNQTINGGHYFIQTEFSNYAYSLNPANSCVLSSDHLQTTVTFNANGGSGTMANETDNTPTALTSNTFTRTRYTFGGWNSAANDTGTAYADAATYAFAAPVTLYAQWTLNPSFTVTFNANGGSGAMSTQTDNTPTALTSTTFTRTRYTFGGWNSAANDTGTAYADAATYAFAAPVTLYAQWTLNPSFTVTFNANGGSGAMSTQTDNTPTALTSTTFTRTRYSFGGWNSAANDTGTAYADAATYAFAAPVTLYAQWTPSTPAPPTNFRATSVGNTTATLAWTAPTPNGSPAILGYNVYAGTSPGSVSTTRLNGSLISAGTTFKVAKLIDGHHYHFTVEAVNGLGSSVASNEAAANPKQGATVTSLALSKTRVAHRAQRTVNFIIRVTGRSSGLPMGGIVKVKVGARALCTARVASNGTARCALRANDLAVGRFAITAAYAGTADYRKSVSVVRRLRVLHP